MHLLLLSSSFSCHQSLLNANLWQPEWTFGRLEIDLLQSDERFVLRETRRFGTSKPFFRSQGLVNRHLNAPVAI